MEIGFGDSFLSRLHSNFNLLIWNCSEKSFLTETSLSKLNFVDFEFEQLIWIFAKDIKTRSRIVSISPPISLLQIDATRLIHSLCKSQYISGDNQGYPDETRTRTKVPLTLFLFNSGFWDGISSRKNIKSRSPRSTVVMNFGLFNQTRANSSSGVRNWISIVSELLF